MMGSVWWAVFGGPRWGVERSLEDPHVMIHDPRAKQALYMGQQRRSARVPRKLHRLLIIIGPIVIALVILWALLF